MMRCPEECRKQWRPKQEKLDQQKQMKKEEREENRKRQEERKQRKKKREKKKPRKENTIEVKRLAKKWEIWDKDEEAVKSEAEAMGLVSKYFYKWIQIFEKKASKWMLTRKL